MKKLFTEEQENYIRENYRTMEYKEIAKNLSSTERQVRGWVNSHKLSKLRKINDHYFDTIDSPLKAYFLGYIYADGWVIFDPKNRNYEFGIELQSDDKYILEKLNDELGGKNIILHKFPKDKVINGVKTRSGDIDSLRIYSKNIVSGLYSNGIVTQKTQKDIYPIVNENYFFDYLRGYIDGDGCFYKYKNNYIYLHITCSSIENLKYCQYQLDKYNINSKIYKENDKKYRLFITDQNEMKKLVNHLYYADDLFCLKRKYEKIKHYIGSAV